MFICTVFWVFDHLIVCLFVCIFVRMFICLYVCLFACLFVGPESSCWCLLLDELLTYAQTTPHVFLSGLMLLSELLPLPLPIYSPKVMPCFSKRLTSSQVFIDLFLSLHFILYRNLLLMRLRQS